MVSKEHNTAKGVSIATEFNKFKDVLFNKKLITHKMKKIQRHVLDDGIYTLSYFYKNSVKSCNN